MLGHVGNNIEMDYPLFSLAPGEPINAYAGCDRTLGTCRTKFNNVPNRLGFDWTPRENPYDITLGPKGAGDAAAGGTKAEIGRAYILSKLGGG